MQFIDDRAIDRAIDRVIANPASTRVLNDHDKSRHRLPRAATPWHSRRYTDPVTGDDPARGRALGYTMVMPARTASKTRSQLLPTTWCTAWVGASPRKSYSRDPIDGPANDIQQATKTARAMVTDYGMSDRIGMVKLGDADTGPSATGQPKVRAPSPTRPPRSSTKEVRRLLDNAMREARILTNNRAILDTLAARLLEEGNPRRAQLAQIFRIVKAPNARVELPVRRGRAQCRLGSPVGVSSA